ncbi:DNA-binding MarR family transcriptional regulator [Rhodopseudomonas julia]|uniref:DNA-binding MarR family transcriptional regulator n=1 Tax=Rhodopseudomonas julia TaxID=200617 RepID=A0ABU0C7Z5_9BRAD|nr:MarR family transcriptional regulator [Rhodopseudomonas julia]MDQ0325177.1 DNA-binding MarR family transcriptional regulator [Rhodopseudomonas julia]
MTILRSSQALRLWYEVTLSLVRAEEPDLTARQMTVLLIVYLEAPPHTVRGLAAKLGVTKAVITRALDTLGRHGLLTRKRDPKDMRNVLVQRTVDGALFLERFADLVVAKTEDVTR